MRRLRSYLGLHVLRVLAMPAPGAARGGRADGVRYGALSEAEARAWAADPELELDAERVSAALARGDVCIGARDGDTPIGYVWYAYGPTPHLGPVWVDCGRRARYSYKAFVRASHRSRGIARELYRQAYRLAPMRGRELSLLAIDFDNEASLAASLRAGRRVVGYAGFALCAGALLGTFRSPGARAHGFRFVARRRAQDPLVAGEVGGLARNSQSL